ncbi:hypothetical protein [Streptomyces collinus]|uniref:hypothetical protein n=1 Tax=Streptomyces collinus TaxID=42684 RepID=UPI0038307A42
MAKPPAAASFVATHSILTMDARHPYTAKSLVDAQDMHRTVMSGFLNCVGLREPARRLHCLGDRHVPLGVGDVLGVEGNEFVGARLAAEYELLPQLPDAFRLRLITGSTPCTSASRSP